MAVNIIEFKARVPDPQKVEALLKSLHPVFKGEDQQVDTYFNSTEGRLKLREGNIENALIWYSRPNDRGPKKSEVLLYEPHPASHLKDMLLKANGVKVVVNKRRRIYFIDNVKFHFDDVMGLGQFIEVEAIDAAGDLGIEKLQSQCDHYAQLFGIKPEHYIDISYSDMLMRQQKGVTTFPVLTTERLLLRQIVQEDIEHVFRGLSHPEVTKYFAVSFHTLEATQEQMDWYANMILQDTGRCWAICSRDNETFYGVCTLNFWDKTHRKAETGYWLFPEFWGKGFALEAMNRVFDYGFIEMQLNRISAEVEDGNPASAAILIKTGFEYEGKLKNCEIKDGKCINLQLYAKMNPNLVADAERNA